MEFCAGLYLRSKALGEPNILSDQQMADVIEKLSAYSVQQQA